MPRRRSRSRSRYRSRSRSKKKYCVKRNKSTGKLYVTTKCAGAKKRFNKKRTAKKYASVRNRRRSGGRRRKSSGRRRRRRSRSRSRSNFGRSSVKSMKRRKSSQYSKAKKALWNKVAPCEGQDGYFTLCSAAQFGFGDDKYTITQQFKGEPGNMIWRTDELNDMTIPFVTGNPETGWKVVAIFNALVDYGVDPQTILLKLQNGGVIDDVFELVQSGDSNALYQTLYGAGLMHRVSPGSAQNPEVMSKYVRPNSNENDMFNLSSMFTLNDDGTGLPPYTSGVDKRGRGYFSPRRNNRSLLTNPNAINQLNTIMGSAPDRQSANYTPQFQRRMNRQIRFVGDEGGGGGGDDNRPEVSFGRKYRRQNRFGRSYSQYF